MPGQRSENKSAARKFRACQAHDSAADGLCLPPAVCHPKVWTKHSSSAKWSPSQAKDWSLSCLSDVKPSARFDVWQLRSWLQTRLQRLQHRCGGQELGQPALAKYAEQVVDVYNAAFQELTKQVSAGCNDRGQLMADIWTSTNALLGRMLVHVKTQTEGFKAMALALKRKEAVTDDACNKLHQMLIAKTAEVDKLRRQVRSLEERLEFAEIALWDHGQKDKPKQNA